MPLSLRPRRRVHRKRKPVPVATGAIPWEQIIQNNTSGMIVVDAQHPDLPIVYVNRMVEEYTGYSQAELVGKNPRLFQGEDREQIGRTIIRQAIQNQQPCKVILRNYRKDGSLYWNELHVSPIRDANGVVTHFVGVQNDITARVEAEQSLRESEGRFRQMAENLKDVLIRFGKDSKSTYISPSVYQLLGYYPEQLLGTPGDGLLHPEDRLQTQRMVQQAIASDSRGVIIPQRLRHKDGHYVWVESSVTLVRNTKTGDLEELIAVVHDDSEHKLMEEELRKSENHWRSLLQSQTSFLIRADMDYHYTYVNNAFAKWYGCPAEQLIGKSMLEAFDLSDYSKTYSTLQECLANPGQAVRVELTKKCEDGSVRYTLWEFIVLLDGQGDFSEVQCMGFDVTHQHELEVALRESEEKYRLIAENTSDGIATWDNATRRFAYTSPSYDRMLGVLPGTVITWSTEDYFQRVHPGDLADMVKRVQTAVFQNEKTILTLYRMRHGDGHYIWKEDHYNCLYSPDGKLVRQYIISRDVTERKQAEERALQLQLEQERAAILTKFIRDAAHEFRTPLSIIGSSAFLLMNAKDAENRARKKGQIDQQVTRITRLVDTLMMMVQLESHDTLNTNRTRLWEVVDMTCAKMLNVYGGKPSIQVVLPDSLPDASVDVGLLSEAFIQLLDNACRFTPPDGTVTVTGGEAEGRVWLCVTDTGRGIEADDLPNIFKTFWRKDDAHSSAGFGLGLPIVHRIVNLHGGMLTVESQIGQGTCARIELPSITE